MQTRIIFRKTAKNSLGSFGGAHRTAQLSELVYDAGFSLTDIETPQLQSNFFRNYVTGFRLNSKLKFRQKLSVYDTAVTGRHFLELKSAMDKLPRGSTVLWEYSSHSLVPYVARERDLNVIATPHNIESLAPTYKDTYNHCVSSQNIGQEVSDLSKASAVFTISQEECWLLNSLQLKAEWLPYFPPQALLKRMQNIRKCRAIKSAPASYLVLGSANHAPTRDGMVCLANQILQLNLEQKAVFQVVGQDTEKLQGPFENPIFKKRGRLSDAELDAEIAKSTALLVFQNFGPGCLTRISEVLAAGLPVIANPIAARSYLATDGVHIFQSPVELHSLLQSALPNFNPPKRPVVLESEFQKRLVGMT